MSKLAKLTQHKPKLNRFLLTMEEIYRAIFTGDVLMVERLLKEIPDINNYSETLPLLCVSSVFDTDNNIRITKLLLERGADPNICNSQRLPVLDLAISNFSLPHIILLLEYGAKVDFIDKYGQTYLHRVLTTTMMCRGAGIDFPEEQVYKIVTLLLERGIDIHHRDKDGRLALDILGEDCPKIKQLIEDYTIDIKEPDV